jgi:Na+/H+ antiporter NhaC
MSADMRIKRTALDRRRRSARVALAVFAVLALSLLPLRAWCELGSENAAQTTGEHQGLHGGGQSDPCCAGVSDDTLVTPTTPVISGASSAFLVVLVLPALILSGFMVPRLRLTGAPPPSRSYYVRSARILR